MFCNAMQCMYACLVSIICFLFSTIYCLLSTIYYLLSNIYFPLSTIYDDRLFGGLHKTAMGGWEMTARASMAQESQVRRKLHEGWGKGMAFGWSCRNCKSAQDTRGLNEFLFVCPKLLLSWVGALGGAGRWAQFRWAGSTQLLKWEPFPEPEAFA